ncbi:MAG TPA: ATP-binding protein [Polyangiaceae bacterium]
MRRPPESLWGPSVLGEREELLLEAERIAHVGTWAWDMKTGTVAWSEELYRILGRDPHTDEATFENFIASIQADDRALVMGLSQRASAGDVAERADFRVQRPDGTIREVMGLAQIFRDAGGVPHRMVGAIIDMTDSIRAGREVERALERLEDAQRLAHVGSWTFDPVRGDVEWSSEVYRILGLPPETRPSIEALFERLHPDDHAAALERVARLGSAIPFDSVEYRLVRPDGSVRHVYFDTQLKKEAGVRLYVGTMIDVTERKLLEQQLVQSQKMEALGRLAGGIAHDFNNLLTVILLSVDFLSKHAGVHGSRVEEIRNAAGRAASLTGQLLAFSRRAPLRPVPLDLNAVITRTRTLLERVIGEDIEVTFSPAAEAPTVLAPEAQLEQVLLNLAVNARDAMPSGGHLTIRTVVQPRSTSPRGGATGRQVRISVADSGTGMDATTRARIFEPFFTTKEQGKGTGLGLATVFGIVSQCGGTVEVESELGKGSTFHVVLPCTDATAIAPETARPRAGTSAGSGETILLVEDDTAVRTTVAGVLSEAGYEVLAAERPSRALALWEQHRKRVALLLCDVVMPELDGRQLAARLCESEPTLRVVLMTGHDPGAGGPGPVGSRMLAKPFSPAELLAMVSTAIDRAALPRAPS